MLYLVGPNEWHAPLFPSGRNGDSYSTSSSSSSDDEPNSSDDLWLHLHACSWIKKNWYPVDFSPPKDEPSAGDAATEAAAGHLAAIKTIYLYICTYIHVYVLNTYMHIYYIKLLKSNLITIYKCVIIYIYHPKYPQMCRLATLYPKDCFLSPPACPRWAAVGKSWWCWAWIGACRRRKGNGCCFTSGIRASNSPTEFPSLHFIR